MIAAVSLVEVSVSMLSALKVRSITRRNIRSRSAVSTATSVRNSVISVAMSGSIMPTPLAMPTTRASPTAACATLGTVSVVMIARAAATASVPSNGGASEARWDRTRSIG